MTDDWRARVDAVWADADELSDDEVLTAIDALVAERPPGDPEGLFEAAGARDYAGREAEAEPRYREALDAGLPDPLRSRAIIQLASTLRNLGRAEEAADLLRAEFADAPDHPLADAAAAFQALALFDAGAPRAALATALRALAPHLPAYSRSIEFYADELN